MITCHVFMRFPSGFKPLGTKINIQKGIAEFMAETAKFFPLINIRAVCYRPREGT